MCIGTGSSERSQSAKTGLDIINLVSLGGGSVERGFSVTVYLADPPIYSDSKTGNAQTWSISVDIGMSVCRYSTKWAREEEKTGKCIGSYVGQLMCRNVGRIPEPARVVRIRWTGVMPHDRFDNTTPVT
jgi:hypothetical protein